MPRFQLSRKAGYRMPAGGVSAARPSALGNPFSHPSAEYAVRAFALYARESVFPGSTNFGWVAATAAGQPTGAYVHPACLPTPVRIGQTVPDPTDPRRRRNKFVPDPDFPAPLTLVRLPDLVKFRLSFLKHMDNSLGCFCPPGTTCHVDAIERLIAEYLEEVKQLLIEAGAEP